MDIYKSIINEYFDDMSITPFAINIIETKDVKSAYYKIRPDQVGKDDRSDGYYNGFCVPPKDTDGLFTLLLDKNIARKRCTILYFGECKRFSKS